MFKILFGFVIIGFINAGSIRYKRDDNGYEAIEVQDHNLEQLESKYSENLRNDIDKDTESDSLGQDNYYSGPISAAIKTKRYHRVLPMSSTYEETSPHVIEIEPYRQPFHFIFKTESNPLSVQQIHRGLPGHTEETQSDDEPHRVAHKVFRPVIQEIREIIQPYRRIKQEIRPVLEEVHTIVAQNDRGEERSANSYRRATVRGETYAAADEQHVRKIKATRQQQQELPKLQEDQDDKMRTMRTSDISAYDMSLANEYSNRKGRHQSENDSFEQKPKETNKYREFSPEVTSIMEQMNSLLGEERIRRKDLSLGSYQPLKQQIPILTNNSLIPLSSLNSGRVKILAKMTGRPVYSD